MANECLQSLRNSDEPTQPFSPRSDHHDNSHFDLDLTSQVTAVWQPSNQTPHDSLQLQSRLCVSVTENQAIFTLSGFIKPKNGRPGILLYLFVYPENIVSIEYKRKPLMPTIDGKPEHLIELRFNMTQRPTLIAPEKTVPEDEDLVRRMLSLASQQHFTLHLSTAANALTDTAQTQLHNLPKVMSTYKPTTDQRRTNICGLYGGRGGCVVNLDGLEALVAGPSSKTSLDKRVEDPSPQYSPKHLLGSRSHSSRCKRKRTSQHQSASLPPYSRSISTEHYKLGIEFDKQLQNSLLEAEARLEQGVIKQVQQRVDQSMEQSSHKLRRTVEQEVKRQTRGVVRRVEQKATLVGKRPAKARGKMPDVREEMASVLEERVYLRQEVANLREEMANLRGEMANLRGEMANLRGEARQEFNPAQEALELARGHQKMCEDSMKWQQKMLESSMKLSKMWEDSVKRPLAENSEVRGSGALGLNHIPDSVH
ncbi:hypothetical protein QBC43DRAFT_53884 [Cladorrhinum sp. PSN259]|nr:hypothetical protein QBC43DRAFT_53884 [Cladorrhinum sp. PSN259]